MNKYFKYFVSAFAAGAFIGVGCYACNICENPYIGALLFCVGLYCICAMKLNLFTGKVGFVTPGGWNRTYLSFLLIVWIGNFAGAAMCAGCIHFANPDFYNIASAIATKRVAQPVLKTIVLGILCGALVHASVWIAVKREKFLGIFLCIPAFILCGFEHCVADMFLFVAAHSIPLWHLVIVSLANSAGAITLNGVLNHCDVC